MIAVDTNILVYAHRRDSPWNAAARPRVAELAESGNAWAIPWPCVHEFLAVTTHPGIYDPPTPLDAALVQIEAWMESPGLVLLTEGGSYWKVLRGDYEGSGRARGSHARRAHRGIVPGAWGFHAVVRRSRFFEVRRGEDG